MFTYHASDRLFIIPPFFAIGIIISLLSLWWGIGVTICCCIGVILLCTPLLNQSILVKWICVSLLIGSIVGINYQRLYFENYPLEKIIKNITITGQIVDIQDNANTPRIIVKLQNSKQQKLPSLIRLNITKSDYKILRYDDILSAQVFLAPPAKPMFKGAYDFAFYAKLNGFGATGRIWKITKHIPNSAHALWGDIHTVRLKIADKIQAILPQNTASPAIAMITGSRFDIPESIANAWKSSGIYHLLSISGLHMTIIAGLCFAVIRRLLLCIPVLAYGGKVKKITAACVIPIAYGYVLLSGGAVPVMRAYIMVCVGLIALLCNQRMITLRSACVAFCLVLLINPVDIFNVGFGLSFAAVFGIIIAVNSVAFLKNNFGFSKITSFLTINFFAGYAGMPLALYTFGSNAVFGLLSNSIAVPIASIIVMPLITLSVFLMVFDLHYYPFIIVGWCIDALNVIAVAISEFPQAVLYQQPPSLLWVVIFYCGLYVMAMNTKNCLRIGGSVIICAIIGYSATPKHDYLYIPSEKTIFYVNANHKLVQLVLYDKEYFNAYLKEQILLYFGHNPKTPYYYEKCQYHKTYVTLSKHHFKCRY